MNHHYYGYVIFGDMSSNRPPVVVLVTVQLGILDSAL